MRRRFWATVAACSLAAGLAAGPRLTVYNSDLAVVRETRLVDLKAGRQTLSISGLPSRLDPSSVRLTGRGLRVLQQDFDAGPGSGAGVLDQCLGRTLKAWARGGRSYAGRLLSHADGQLILRQADGGLLMLNRARLSALELPPLPGARSRPGLSWDLEAKTAGRQTLALTYLCGGLRWHADYVAVLDPAGRALGLDAWASLDNQSGGDFKTARLALMAGDLPRAAPSPHPLMMRAAVAQSASGAPTFTERTFADDHLYRLGTPVDLVNGGRKQVRLFSAAAVPVEKAYTYDGEQDPRSVRVSLTLKNDQADGLGRPLPAGRWRVYQADGAGRVLLGEDQVGPRPRGETLRLDLGAAFDVVGRRTVLRERSDAQGRLLRRDVKVEIRNRRADAVTVTLREHAWGAWDLGASNLAWKRVDASTFSAQLALKAGEVKDWTYTLKMVN